ncbi:MAG: hypothetical protein EP330_15030 [Deltaproteobacteria bacterium]|nr:MAG: hypothetical protein EP330_15030 [Deltaproteobacteria bacterium]
MRPDRVWFLLLLTGCGRASLVDHTQWLDLSADEDPAGDRPDVVDCPPSAWFVESVPETALEVDTGACNYLAMSQPSLVGSRGDQLHLRFAHGDLEADIPAEAHVALYIGDTVAFSQRMEIPTAADEYEVDLAVESFGKGEPVTLHLHNHGANTWSFAELSTGP